MLLHCAAVAIRRSLSAGIDDFFGATTDWFSVLSAGLVVVAVDFILAADAIALPFGGAGERAVATVGRDVFAISVRGAEVLVLDSADATGLAVLSATRGSRALPVSLRIILAGFVFFANLVILPARAV